MTQVMPMYGATSDVGSVRELNEDSVLARFPLFAVADGMGGHAAGEVASQLALTALAEAVSRTVIDQDALAAAIGAANQAILDWSSQRPETAGMGTTLTGVALGEFGGTPHWFVFNVGDSRVYRLANGLLTQVTTDHSEVEELISLGQITPDEARVYPRRNVVTRSLGSDPAPVADIWTLPAEPGETFLACSDGLTLEVAEERIAELLGGNDPRAAAELLVAEAVAAGARDNVSAVVVSIPHTSAPDEAIVSTAPRRLITGMGE